ncbi:MAG: divalent-cation tolerance protein CutA [Rickettsiales bacterium]|nr:divalent-cation tolerance protein CutA [Rickettsiales bacterium]
MIIVETTLPNKELARQLSNLLIKNKLCACVHMFQIESIYSWNEEVQTSNEVSLRIKTDQRLLNEIKEFISKNHPYEVPEIVATTIIDSGDEYQNWLKTSLKN